MEHLGGLIHRMPLTSFAFLVGCAAISALPPLNGFVSEWLTFQAILISPDLPQWGLKFSIPAVGALLALSAALAAACFVKAYRHHLPRPAAHAMRRARDGGRPLFAFSDVSLRRPLRARRHSAGLRHRRARRRSPRISSVARCRPSPRCLGCRSCRSRRAAAPITGSSSSSSSLRPRRWRRSPSTDSRRAHCAAPIPGIAASRTQAR